MSHLPPLVLVSAGKSSRLGTPKGLYPFAGKTWLEVQLDSLQLAGIHRVHVVLGYSAKSYYEALPWLSDASGISVSENPSPELGMFSSLQSGLEIFYKDPRVYFMPIDTPCPNVGVWQALADAGSAYAVIPQFESRGGHPVLLNNAFMRQILSTDPQSPKGRLDYCIRSLDSSRVQYIKCYDEFITHNLNTPDDFANLTSI